jgi:hypothetical protein
VTKMSKVPSPCHSESAILIGGRRIPAVSLGGQIVCARAGEARERGLAALFQGNGALGQRQSRAHAARLGLEVESGVRRPHSVLRKRTFSLF